MKLYAKKDSALKIEEHGISTFYEYPIDFTKMSVGVSEINGEYPQHGFDIDTEVEAVWYVLSGTGEVIIEDERFTLNEGDMIKVPQNNKFKIIGNTLKLVVISSPPWTAEQHKHVE
jgi:mannose-6-phosphate isomerase-like protein (cupin superfamily)